MMLAKKREHPKEKSKLHPRNKHRARYDFKKLIESCKELSPFVMINAYGDESIDFFNPEAVKMLNKALLKHFYNIENWDIPNNYLCPPIPGRADYIHYMADMLRNSNDGTIPNGNKITCLDIGVGANCVYPIIGINEYDWFFVGSDIDKLSIESATKINASNVVLKDKIELRFQPKHKNIFTGIIKKNEFFDLTICNPPFHASSVAANSETLRKLSNLKDKKVSKPVLNFGGKNNELWCDGGEKKFVQNMILESKAFSASCFWFSALISKHTNLESAYNTLKEMEATEIKTISMGQGNKISRIVAWTFLNKEQQKNWISTKWNELSK